MEGKGPSELLLNAKCVVVAKKLLPALQLLFFAVACVTHNETSSESTAWHFAVQGVLKVAVLMDNEYFYGTAEFSIPDYQLHSP